MPKPLLGTRADVGRTARPRVRGPIGPLQATTYMTTGRSCGFASRSRRAAFPTPGAILWLGRGSELGRVL